MSMATLNYVEVTYNGVKLPLKSFSMHKDACGFTIFPDTGSMSIYGYDVSIAFEVVAVPGVELPLVGDEVSVGVEQDHVVYNASVSSVSLSCGAAGEFGTAQFEATVTGCEELPDMSKQIVWSIRRVGSVTNLFGGLAYSGADCLAKALATLADSDLSDNDRAVAVVHIGGGRRVYIGPMSGFPLFARRVLLGKD